MIPEGWEYDMTITTALRRFLEAEIANEKTMIEQARTRDEIPPASCLDTAMDSWIQAPDDVQDEWVGGARESVGRELVSLRETLGGETRLGWLMEYAQ